MPARLNATPQTQLVWPLKMRTCLPVAGSHSRAVVSPLAVASSRPSGLNATPLTGPLCPVRVRRCSPVAGSHSRAVVSQLAVASSGRPG